MNKILSKRLDRLEKDNKMAEKLKAKLKLTPPIKFGPFHFYRRVLGGLPIDGSFLDSMTDGKDGWKPRGNKFGEHRVTWSEWRKRISTVCPIQYYFREDFLSDLYYMFNIRHLKDLWYKTKCTFWYRYNILKIKTLPPTWCDEDTLMLHAMMAVLERYMKQKPDEIIDVVNCEEQKVFWQEINIVWNWWNQRAEREKKMDEAMNLCSEKPRTNNPRDYFERYKEYNDLEDQYNKEEDEMLALLLKNRRGLWI